MPDRIGKRGWGWVVWDPLCEQQTFSMLQGSGTAETVPCSLLLSGEPRMVGRLAAGLNKRSELLAMSVPLLEEALLAAWNSCFAKGKPLSPSVVILF